MTPEMPFGHHIEKCCGRIESDTGTRPRPAVPGLSVRQTVATMLFGYGLSSYSGRIELERTGRGGQARQAAHQGGSCPLGGHVEPGRTGVLYIDWHDGRQRHDK